MSIHELLHPVDENRIFRELQDDELLDMVSQDSGDDDEDDELCEDLFGHLTNIDEQLRVLREAFYVVETTQCTVNGDLGEVKRGLRRVQSSLRHLKALENQRKRKQTSITAFF